MQINAYLLYYIRVFIDTQLVSLDYSVKIVVRYSDTRYKITLILGVPTGVGSKTIRLPQVT